MEKLMIGDKSARVPVVQGGMGVGVSRSKLAGAVAAEGGVGVISTAQIGYDEEGFRLDHRKANRSAIEKHVRLAKEQARGGLVGVNVMVALKDYREHVRTAAEAGADVVICGAGLPMDLPELVEGTDAKIAPIVSSEKAADVILKLWERRYHRTADFLVIEGPKAGGHLGFSEEELARQDFDYDSVIQRILETVRGYEERFQRRIPMIVAGGIYSAEDAAHVLRLGAAGVQVATRFVATEECDAAPAYKEAYIRAEEADVAIVKSPVGMPGRALRNAFLRRVEAASRKPERCYGCLSKCDPARIPYCITEALIRAVEGDVENGLIFCGANVGRIKEMSTVRRVMEELMV